MNYEAITIINVSRLTYKREAHMEKHCHNFYHLLFVTGGKGTICIKDEENKVMTNDLYVFCPDVYHEIMSDTSDPLRTLEVKFMTKDHESPAGLTHLPVRTNTNNKKIRMLLDGIVKEATHKEPFFKEMISIKLLELILQLGRMNHNNCSYYAKNERDNGCESSDGDLLDREDICNPELIAKVLKYIQEKYKEKITLAELSNVYHVNHSYLCRIFRNAYGFAPIQYVNNLRIGKAKELLDDSNLSITEVAYHSGFHSIHYLSRYFMNKVKMSPMEYRQRSKESVILTVDERYKIDNFKVEVS